jgi:multidrug efflux system outer membrane protein
MRPFLLATAGLAVLAVSACASNAPVRTPNVALPSAFSQPGQAAVALDRWWTSYNDPELTKLIEDALATAPDAQMIDQRLIEARATRASQIYSAYPTGNAVAGVTRADTSQLSGGNIFSVPGASTTYTANFDVSWEIDLFGRVRVARRAVDNNYAATRFNIEASRASLAANVADSLFNIRGLAQQLEDAKESQKIAANLNNAAQIRLERGFGAKLDVDRTGADLAQANATLVQTQSDLNTTKRTLLVLLGRAGDSIDTLPADPLTDAPPPAPTELPSQLLERRPDVRQAEQQLYLAIAQLKIDRLALFPKFTIMPGVGITDLQSFGITGFSQVGGAPSITVGPTTSKTSNWSIGGNISVPVLNRPQLLQTAKASGAKAEEAVITYEKTVQTAFGETDNLLVQYAADQSRLVLLVAGEAQARSAYDNTQLLYDRGLTDLTTLLQAEQAWRAARTGATSARTQALRRSVQAYKALGGGWTVPAGLPLPGPNDLKAVAAKPGVQQP